MITRRSLFEFLAIAPAAPAIAKVVSAPELPEKRVVRLVQGQHFTPRAVLPDTIRIERAFILLGLIAPGDALSSTDMDFARGVLNSSWNPRMSDRELALEMADYYGVRDAHLRISL